MNKLLLLLKYELKSTSLLNIRKYGDDKQRKNATGSIVGLVIVYALLIGLSYFSSMFLAQGGFEDAVITLSFSVITIISLIFTLMKTNGYMFAFKEYEMLTSMPFSDKQIAMSRFLYMYVKNLKLTFSVMIPAIIACVMFGSASVASIIIWIFIAFFTPMIPMAISSAIGTLIAGASTKFKYKKLVQTIFSFIFIALCFSARFIFQAIGQKYHDVLLDRTNDVMNHINRYYPMANFAHKSVTDNSILYLLLFVVISVAFLELCFFFISRNYRKINSKLKTNGIHKDYKLATLKSKSLVKAISINEFRRFKGSVNYIVNMGFGFVIVVILAILSFFVDLDSVISMISSSSALNTVTVLPIIPVVVHFFVGMIPTTAVSYSLEGKQMWIIRSMPIPMYDLVKGKMRFNFLISIPFAIFANVCFGIAFKASALQIVVFVVESILLTLMATVWGMRLGLKKPMLEWENEIEVIKRSPSIVRYMVPDMIITVFVVIIGVFVGKINFYIANGGIILLVLIIILLNYVGLKRICKKGYFA